EMKTGDIHQLSFLDKAYQEIRSLKELASRIKAPPKDRVGQVKEHYQKKERSPLQETSNDFNLSSQAKDTQNHQRTQSPDAEILKFLIQQSACSFTTKGIQRIASELG